MPGLSYQDYLRSLAGDRYVTDESQTTDTAMGEEAWGQLDPNAQYQRMGTAGGHTFGNATGGGFQIDRGSEIAGRYNAANPDQQFAGADENRYFVSQNKPSDDVLRAGAWQDPDTGMWVVPHENVRPDYLQGIQEASDTSGLFAGNTLQNILTGASIVLGGAAGAGALGLEGGMTAADIGLSGAGVVGDAEQALASQVAGQGGVGTSLGLDAAEVVSLAPGYGVDAGALDLTNVGAGQGLGLESPYSLGPNSPDLSTITGPIEQTTANPILDPIRDYATRLSTGVVGGGGGSMANAGAGALGIDGLSWGDILNYGSRLVGTGLNANAQGDASQLGREQLAQALQIATMNQQTPYGNVDFTIGPDGRITRRVTLNADDERNLGYRRDIQRRVGENADKPFADYTTPFIQQALTNQSRSFGGGPLYDQYMNKG
jgi:hypothetical protein